MSLNHKEIFIALDEKIYLNYYKIWGFIKIKLYGINEDIENVVFDYYIEYREFQLEEHTTINKQYFEDLYKVNPERAIYLALGKLDKIVQNIDKKYRDGKL